MVLHCIPRGTFTARFFLVEVMPKQKPSSLEVEKKELLEDGYKDCGTFDTGIPVSIDCDLELITSPSNKVFAIARLPKRIKANQTLQTLSLVCKSELLADKLAEDFDGDLARFVYALALEQVRTVLRGNASREMTYNPSAFSVARKLAKENDSFAAKLAALMGEFGIEVKSRE